MLRYGFIERRQEWEAQGSPVHEHHLQEWQEDFHVPADGYACDVCGEYFETPDDATNTDDKKTDQGDKGESAARESP